MGERDRNEKAWIQTWTGVKFYPLDPRPEEIRVADVAHALSNLCRFTGQALFISVAEHSVRVSRRCEDLQRSRCEEDHGLGYCPAPATAAKWGLLHDAAEAYLNDLARPVKHQPELAAYRAAEDRLLGMVAEKFGLEPGFWKKNVVERADNEMLVTERRDVFAVVHPDWDATVKQLWPALGHVRVEGWEPRRAEREFLERYMVLFG